MTAAIYIGTQGWNYDGWSGSFYPSKTLKKDFLSLYGKVFNTVEIDSSFYAVPSENSIRGWYKKTPLNFKFSLKLPSEITHKNRLRDCEATLFSFSSRVLLLKEKLGCVLIQFPPDFSPSEHRIFSNFLKLLPEKIKFAIELRDQRWISPSLIDEIEGHNASLALVDGKWINRDLSIRIIEFQKSSFQYVRWLGSRELTDFSKVQRDRTKEFIQWQEAFIQLGKNTSEIYGYFNNHFQGHSPSSANYFKKLLGLPVNTPDILVVQPSLF